MGGWNLPDDVSQADIDRAYGGEDLPDCLKCMQSPCECCRDCGAPPTEACEPWCGDGNEEMLPEDHIPIER